MFPIFDRSQRREPAIRNIPPNIQLRVPPMIDDAFSNVIPVAAHTWCLLIRDTNPRTQNPNARMMTLTRGAAFLR
jgi:hypothetical protein